MRGDTSGDAAPIDPADLVEVLQPVVAHGLLAFDVDGVLAPIVEHADRSRLQRGVRDSLERLADRAVVMILSGRSLESLERLFGFPPALHVIGSHGLEIRGDSEIILDDRERSTFEQLRILGENAVEAAGEGAWLESKPASVVVHTREADQATAEPAVAALEDLAVLVDGAHVKHGHEVVELLARHASKGDTLLRFARRVRRAPIAYFGDDVTDEDAFAVMSPDDVSVRVGPGDTAARFRLADAATAAEVVRLLADRAHLGDARGSAGDGVELEDLGAIGVGEHQRVVAQLEAEAKTVHRRNPHTPAMGAGTVGRSPTEDR